MVNSINQPSVAAAAQALSAPLRSQAAERTAATTPPLSERPVAPTSTTANQSGVQDSVTLSDRATQLAARAASGNNEEDQRRDRVQDATQTSEAQGRTANSGAGYYQSIIRALGA